MKIYSAQDCLQNPLYADLMDDLNILYSAMGEPPYNESTAKFCITHDEYWQPSIIGNLNGKEQALSRTLNEQLWHVYDGIRFTSTREHTLQNQSDSYQLFVKRSIELIDDYNLNRTHNKLPCMDYVK